MSRVAYKWVAATEELVVPKQASSSTPTNKYSVHWVTCDTRPCPRVSHRHSRRERITTLSHFNAPHFSRSPGDRRGEIIPRVLPILFFCLFLFIYLFIFFFPEHESTRNNGLFVPRRDRAALCSGAARTETQNVLRTVYATLNELYDSRASEVRTWSCHGARARYSKTRGIDASIPKAARLPQIS